MSGVLDKLKNYVRGWFKRPDHHHGHHHGHHHTLRNGKGIALFTSPHVIHLRSDGGDVMVNASGALVIPKLQTVTDSFVELYSPTCPHCVNSQDHVNGAATATRPLAVLNTTLAWPSHVMDKFRDLGYQGSVPTGFRVVRGVVQPGEQDPRQAFPLMSSLRSPIMGGGIRGRRHRRRGPLAKLHARLQRHRVRRSSSHGRQSR